MSASVPVEQLQRMIASWETDLSSLRHPLGYQEETDYIRWDAQADILEERIRDLKALIEGASSCAEPTV